MYFLVGCFRNLANEEINEGFQVEADVENSFTITKSHPNVTNIILNNNYLAYIGSAAFHEIASNFFGIQIFNNKQISEKVGYIYLSNFMQYLETYSTALWFVKDNAVMPSFGTISSDESGITPSLLRRNNIVSNAKGGNEVTRFSKKDFIDAVKWYEILFANAKRIDSNKIEVPKGHQNLSPFMTFDVPSFERAKHFLDAARKADFLPSKIANYISILECLFAVKGENTHKVSERAAYLLADSSSERLRLFKEVKNAYTVRSNYVHGAEFTNSAHEGLPEVSQKMDEIVRRVLREMILNHPELSYNNSNKKDKTKKDFQGVNNWFDELILTKE